MASNSDIKLHVSEAERDKWDKAAVDLYNHIKAGGVDNHMLGNGTIPGFSMNDFTNAYKKKLDDIENKANHYVHPSNPSHVITEIGGRAAVCDTNSYLSLIDRPTKLPADGGNSTTVSGVRIHISSTTPQGTNDCALTVNKELWVDLNNKTIKLYNSSKDWEPLHTVYA